MVLLITSIKTNGQVLITKNDSIPLGQDTIVKLILPEYRGNVNWQQSLNNIDWVTYNIEEKDTLSINTDTEAYYRARIIDGKCVPTYSDIIKIDIDSIESEINSFIEMAYPDSIGEVESYFFNNDTIRCLKINNEYVFQGDIILTREQLHLDSLKGASIDDILIWPNNTVYYTINENLIDNDYRIVNAINHWSNVTPLRFIKRDNQENYIEFIWDEKSCSSNLGMIEGKQFIKIPDWAITGNIMHEIGHAVGLIHEHSRSDRDNYITVHYDNIIDDEHIRLQFDKMSNCVLKDDFDFFSIMLYGCYDIRGTTSIDKTKPQITKLNGEIYNYNRKNLSQVDIKMIKFLYPPMRQVNGTFTDSRDGHVYKWVKIGDQVWMAENLAYLPSVNPISKESETSPFYYVFNYEGNNVDEAKATSNYKTYGALYNWPAAMISCPAGWHLPSDSEWKQLEMFIGMSQSQADIEGYQRGTDQGKKLKSKNGWFNNGNGTDDYGFSALPGVYSNEMGIPYFQYYGNWYTSTEVSSSYAWLRSISYNDTKIGRYLNKKNGFSMRCVKD